MNERFLSPRVTCFRCTRTDGALCSSRTRASERNRPDRPRVCAYLVGFVHTQTATAAAVRLFVCAKLGWMDGRVRKVINEVNAPGFFCPYSRAEVCFTTTLFHTTIGPAKSPSHIGWWMYCVWERLKLNSFCVPVPVLVSPTRITYPNAARTYTQQGPGLARDRTILMGTAFERTTTSLPSSWLAGCYILFKWDSVVHVFNKIKHIVPEVLCFFLSAFFPHKQTKNVYAPIGR